MGLIDFPEKRRQKKIIDALKRYPFDDFDKLYYSQPEGSSVSYLAKKYLSET